MTNKPESPSPDRRLLTVDPDDVALTRGEHALRASALASAALSTDARGPRLDRLLGVAEIHARLAALPEDVAEEARALFASRAATSAASEPLPASPPPTRQETRL